MTDKNSCRFCNEELSHVWIDLGISPLANSFVSLEQLSSKESFFPLKVFVCKKCFLVQLPEYKNPQKIFKDYAYFSSYSDTWIKHAEDYVNLMLERFDFDNNSLVIEIGSNDGYLLQFLKKNKIPVLGIEPAENISVVAIKKGIPTIQKFFNLETSSELVLSGKKADLLIGNNVLGHVPDLIHFVEAMKLILKSDGIITMEFPHLLKLVENNQFDTIYHEHFSYFSLFTINKIFSFFQLRIFDVDKLDTHGGSLRIYACNSESDFNPVGKKIEELIEREIKSGINNIDFYNNFSSKVEIVKNALLKFLNSAKTSGKKVVCYGIKGSVEN